MRVQIYYGLGCFQVRFGLVVSTVWIASEYGFLILPDESPSESHTQNSSVLGQRPINTCSNDFMLDPFPVLMFDIAYQLIQDKKNQNLTAKLGHNPPPEIFQAWGFCWGRGSWGRKKCRRIPKREGDWQGTSPKVFSLPKTSSKEGVWNFGAPNF